ncbi:hypothetical protein [Streptomyces carminius]|uniref:hypothetical protein n=1 Tax=Streptomyces carminius TaxID=2665496 RepID=UPI0011B4DA84|nr:hypothetical protein [Streptomyces carminius]
MIELTDGEELRPTAFGASVVDHFVRSSERAAREVRSRLRELPEGEDTGEVCTEFRRDWASEAAAVVALVLGVIALLMGI